MTVWFDMDGTIADLYGVEGWLDYLLAEDATPYAEAKPLVNMQALARRLNNLRKRGVEVGVISWLAKTSTAEYDERVIQAKKAWLTRHLASVQFNEIHIVAYGTPKQTIGRGILFDDEEHNRNEWGEGAFEPKDIFKILEELRG